MSRQYDLYKLTAILIALFIAILLTKLLGFYILLVFPLLNTLFDVSYFIRGIYEVFMLRLSGVTLDFLGTHTSTFWVLPSDIDFWAHMNNSRYLREADFARTKFIYGTMFPKCKKYIHGLVVGAITIRYRRSLELFQHVTLKTRVIYWDDKAFYFESQFVTSDGFISAISITKQVLVQKKKQDPITPQELILKLLGKELRRPEPPKELQHWIEYNSASSESLRPSK